MNPTACTDLAMNQYTTTPTDVRTYDRNGNLTSLKNDTAPGLLAISCLYDYRNRMVEYLDSETLQRHTYTYDALGRRIAKTIDAGGASPATTYYLYGGESQWQVCEEWVPDPVLGGAGVWGTSATYVYGRYIDEVLQMQRCEEEGSLPCNSTPPVDYYYHTDDMYNVMAVTDAAGNVVERYEYDDYGTPTFMDAAGNALTLSDGTPRTSAPIANPYLFTGRRYDPESGWYNYRTRYLDPIVGRFTTRDVIGIWGDRAEFGSGYSFVGNNPSSWLDPLGLAPANYVGIKKALLKSCEKECKNRCSQVTPGPDESNPEEGCTTVILVGCFNKCYGGCSKEAEKIAQMIRNLINKCNNSNSGGSCKAWAVRLRWLLNKMGLKYFKFDAIELAAIGAGSHAVLGITHRSSEEKVNGTEYSAWDILIDPTHFNAQDKTDGNWEDQGMDGGSGPIAGEGTHAGEIFNPGGSSIPTQTSENSDEGPFSGSFPP